MLPLAGSTNSWLKATVISSVSHTLDALFSGLINHFNEINGQLTVFHPKLRRIIRRTRLTQSLQSALQ